jgi:hypothetical protein
MRGDARRRQLRACLWGDVHLGTKRTAPRLWSVAACAARARLPRAVRPRRGSWRSGRSYPGPRSAAPCPGPMCAGRPPSPDELQVARLVVALDKNPHPRGRCRPRRRSVKDLKPGPPYIVRSSFRVVHRRLLGFLVLAASPSLFRLSCFPHLAPCCFRFRCNSMIAYPVDRYGQNRGAGLYCTG